jgi:hypothetical protein
MHESLMSPIRISLPNAPPKIIRKELIPDARAIVIIPIRAFRDKRLTAGQFRALGTLCSYANKAGLLWVGLERMGQDLNISKSRMHVYTQALEKLGYIETVYKGFKGERADTRRIIYNPQQTLNQTMQTTQTTAPFIHEKQTRKTKIKQSKQPQSTVNTQDVEQSSMRIENDVMQLKNKVSKHIWQLAVSRAGTSTDFVLLKQTINKLLR